MSRTFELKHIPTQGFGSAPSVQLLRETIPVEHAAGQVGCDDCFLYGIEQPAMKAVLTLKFALQSSDFRVARLWAAVWANCSHFTVYCSKLPLCRGLNATSYS